MSKSSPVHEINILLKIVCVTYVKYEGKASGFLVNCECELNLISEILNLITETAFSLPQYVFFVQTT